MFWRTLKQTACSATGELKFLAVVSVLFLLQCWKIPAWLTEPGFPVLYSLSDCCVYLYHITQTVTISSQFPLFPSIHRHLDILGGTRGALWFQIQRWLLFMRNGWEHFDSDAGYTARYDGTYDHSHWVFCIYQAIHSTDTVYDDSDGWSYRECRRDLLNYIVQVSKGKRETIQVISLHRIFTGCVVLRVVVNQYGHWPYPISRVFINTLIIYIVHISYR